MTTLTAAIAAHYNVTETAILKSAEWQVGETLCKAEYKCERAFFGGKPCYATYKQVVKKIVGQAPRITWELVQNVAADEFLSKLSSFPAGTKFVY